MGKGAHSGRQPFGSAAWDMQNGRRPIFCCAAFHGRLQGGQNAQEREERFCFPAVTPDGAERAAPLPFASGQVPFSCKRRGGGLSPGFFLTRARCAAFGAIPFARRLELKHNEGVVFLVKYIAKRIGYAILTVFLLTALTFFMMRLLPGDPFIGDKKVPEVTLKALQAKYGLDKSQWEQFAIYVSNIVLHGDLGVSIASNREITRIIMDAFPYSFDLGMRSLIIATVFGVALGVLAAIKRGTKWDTISMTIAVVGVSVPSFIVGALLQYFLALKLKMWLGFTVFPITGWNTEASKILPAIALSFSSLATIARLMRTSMLDVLGSDYIKTAKAKGLGQGTIIWKHAIRNAIMPVITVLGPIAAAVLTGAFVVENIFSIPGMGRFFVIAIQNRDYTVIAGTTLFYGAFLVVATLIVDLLYGLIDPRINLAKEEA